MERDGLRFTVEQREHMRQAAWALKLRHKTQQQIADELGVSQATVHYWLFKMKQQHSPEGTAELIAARIRGELVCCNIFQRIEDAATPDEKAKLRTSTDYHAICFYGEWAAQLALQQVSQ